MNHPTIIKLARLLPKRVKIQATKTYHDIGIVALCRNPLKILLNRWSLGNYSGRFTINMRNGLNVDIELETCDPQILAEIFWEKEYTPGFLRRYWSRPKIICDIGANKGLFALYCAWRFPEACIYSYEPDPQLCAWAIDNVRNNNLQDRVTIYNLAIYNKRARLPFQVARGPNRGAGKVLMHKGSDRDTDVILVDSISLTDVVNELGRIDLLKMDVEGAEFEIISEDHTDALKEIRYIALEYHSVAGTEVDRIVDVLRSAGFKTTLLRRKIYAYRI